MSERSENIEVGVELIPIYFKLQKSLSKFNENALEFSLSEKSYFEVLAISLSLFDIVLDGDFNFLKDICESKENYFQFVINAIADYTWEVEDIKRVLSRLGQINKEDYWRD